MTPQPDTDDVDAVAAAVAWRPSIDRGTRFNRRRYVESLRSGYQLLGRHADTGWALASALQRRAIRAETEVRDMRAAMVDLADGMAHAVDAARGAGDTQVTDLLAQRDRLTCDLDQTRAQLQEVQADRDQLAARLARAEDDRDRLHRLLAEAGGEVSAASHRLALMTDVGDELVQRIRDDAHDRSTRSRAAVLKRRWTAAKVGEDYRGATGTTPRPGDDTAT